MFCEGGVSGKPSGAGKRVIIVGIGSRNGFLNSKCFIGDKTKKKQDYHTEMNSEHFEEWFTEVLEIIPAKSVVVIDQASYHKRITPETKNPTTSYRKQQIIDWLVDHNIPVPEEYPSFMKMTVPVLLALARKRKLEPVYVLQKLAEDSGKDVKILWLPVAHCELNAIELIWSAVKREYSYVFYLQIVLPFYNYRRSFK
jgi:transposase